MAMLQFGIAERVSFQPDGRARASRTVAQAGVLKDSHKLGRLRNLATKRGIYGEPLPSLLKYLAEAQRTPS